MKKYLDILLSIFIAWMVLQAINFILRYNQEGIIDFVDMRNWKPFAAVAIVMVVYTFFRGLKIKRK